jgi:hypothetical protein
LGLSVEVVHRSPKPTPEKVVFAWAREWHKEGRSVDLNQLLPRRGFEVRPRRWVVERTYAWICHNRRMSKDYERLCATGEAFVYAAMTLTPPLLGSGWVPSICTSLSTVVSVWAMAVGTRISMATRAAKAK